MRLLRRFSVRSALCIFFDFRQFRWKRKFSDCERRHLLRYNYRCLLVLRFVFVIQSSRADKLVLIEYAARSRVWNFTGFATIWYAGRSKYGCCINIFIFPYRYRISSSSSLSYDSHRRYYRIHYYRSCDHESIFWLPYYCRNDTVPVYYTRLAWDYCGKTST